MSRPQFAREESQRAELKSQATSSAQILKARPKVECAARSAELRKFLNALYSQFREALRQSPPAN